MAGENNKGQRTWVDNFLELADELPWNPNRTAIRVQLFDGQDGALIDSTGNLNVTLAAGSIAVTVADGADVAEGATTDVETASGNGSIVSILKRIRTLLAGGLPAALGAGGGVKVDGSGTALPITDNAGSLTVDQPTGSNLHAVLDAGTAAFGKLAANSGVDIGDVDVTSIAAGDNNIGNVDIVTVPAPLSTTGGGTEATAHRVTIANDSTGVLSVDDNGGNLSIDDGGNSITVDAPVGTPVFVRLSDGSSAIATLPVSLASVPSHAVTNAGTFAVQVDGNALTSLQLIDDPVIQDDSGFTPATSKVMMAGFQADETATDSVDEGDAGAARMTLDRKVIVTVEPHTAGGLTTFMASGSDGSSILTNAAQAIKASAGQLYGYYIYNPNASAIFVHFYNTAAASVTVGTTNPLFTLTIPATSAANLMGACGILFSNAGWSIAATTTAGGNSAPATGLDAVVWYA